ncbi:MAG: DUF3800 domain-containing protein [Bacteroidales bacterium]|nr:DUF3800 domain-containing protein [Bacteroidales bacterium]
MYRFYADDNYAKSPESKKDDIFIYGGILISLENERKLIEDIKRIKSQYTHPNLPIKWNMRDRSLKEIYERFGKQEDLQKLKQNSKKWRRDIIDSSIELDYTLFFSCLENYQKEKKNQKPIKESLTEYMFSNTLMRVGIHAKKLKLNQIITIIDWPADNNPTPFNREYYRAFYNGKSQNNIDYICGPLQEIGFHESVVFAKCTHSTMLQLSDILVGCLKEFLISNFKKKESLGKELFAKLIPKLYGYPNVFSYGINISKQNMDFRNKVKEILSSY